MARRRDSRRTALALDIGEILFATARSLHKA